MLTIRVFLCAVENFRAQKSDCRTIEFKKNIRWQKNQRAFLALIYYLESDNFTDLFRKLTIIDQNYRKQLPFTPIVPLILMQALLFFYYYKKPKMKLNQL